MDFTVKGRKVEPSSGFLGENGKLSALKFWILGVRGVPYLAYRNAAGGTGIARLDAKASGDWMQAVWYAGREATMVPGELTAHLFVSDPKTMSELLRTEPVVFTVKGTVSEPSHQLQVQTPPDPYTARATRIAVSPRIQEPDSEPPITVNERTIVVPPVLQTIAVQNDIRSETVKIRMPQFYDGEDLSQYSIILKCVSEGGRTDLDLTPTMQADGEYITLEWTLRPPETSFNGRLQIQLRAVDGSRYKWETFFTTVQIAESLDAEPVIPVEGSWLDEAISTVAGYVQQAKGSAGAAAGSAQDAAASAAQAALSVGLAQDAAAAAETARDTAAAHAEGAGSAQKAAESAAALAQQAVGELHGYVEAAEQAAQDARTEASKAESAAQTAAEEAAEAAAAQTADAVRGELSGLTAQAESAKTGAEAARDAAELFAKEAENAAGGGVTSFNGRGGAVRPQKGDYSADMIAGLDGLIQAGGQGLAGNLPAGGLLLVIKGASL